MGRITDRERTIRNLVRLRRAERARGGDADLAAVRVDLERSAGLTVPRAMAARLLGLTQPALERWIATGDVPVVLTPRGRREVPLAPLLDLVEAVETSPSRNPLAAVLRQRQRLAATMDVAGLAREAGAEGHRPAELRGLAYHQAVAARLDDRSIGDARERLRRWRRSGPIADEAATRWETLLELPATEIAERIVADDEDGRALRQTSPFAGALTDHERQRLLAAVAG